MNPMVISDPWVNSLNIIYLYTVKKLQGMNPIGIITPWDDSLDVIALQKVLKF